MNGTAIKIVTNTLADLKRQLAEAKRIYNLEAYNAENSVMFDETYSKRHNEHRWQIIGLEKDVERAERHEIGFGDGVSLCTDSGREAYTVIYRADDMITLRRDIAVADNTEHISYRRDPKGEVIKAVWNEKIGYFMFGKMRIINGRHEYCENN